MIQPNAMNLSHMPESILLSIVSSSLQDPYFKKVRVWGRGGGSKGAFFALYFCSYFIAS